MRAANVTSDLIARCVDQRQQEKTANATELAELKRMFRLGLFFNPAQGLPGTIVPPFARRTM